MLEKGDGVRKGKRRNDGKASACRGAVVTLEEPSRGRPKFTRQLNAPFQLYPSNEIL